MEKPIPFQYDVSFKADIFSFQFRLKKHGSGWRIYIGKQPSYKRRPTSASTIHRLSDEAGYYICWRGRIGTPAEARALARMWADKTAEYIATGQTF